jgi:hypothetical protein
VRWLALYLRSRQVPAALTVTVGATVLLWLVGRTNPHAPGAPWAVLAVGLGLGVLGTGLVGADPALERTAAINWPLRRLIHIVAAVAVVDALVVATDLAPVGVVLRDAAGVGGLTALAATALGRQLAWLPAITWTGGAAVIGAPIQPILQVLTWPIQPADSGIAIVVAVVLGIVGALTHAAIGARR